MRKWIITVLVLLLIAIFGYNYIYQEHRDIESEAPKFEITSNAIATNFLDNLKEAEAKFLNETIEVEGLISEITEHSITLDDKVFCQFNNVTPNTLKLNSTIKIKGRVIGYDDLLEQVKLDQSIIN